jgi:hypothetical protein
MPISTKEELRFLPHRGLKIERFESFSAEKGFVAVDSTNRNLVMTLVGDSHAQRLTIEKMLGIKVTIGILWFFSLKWCFLNKYVYI